MNSKEHFLISVGKSAIRIVGCTIGVMNKSIAIIGCSLIAAEVFGVLEELVDKR